MSVSYYLNKKVKIGDLKKIGLEIKDYRSEKNCHPFVVNSKNTGNGVAISVVNTNNDDNVDNWEIKEFEGRLSHGGGDVMIEMCDKLNCMFVTDEDMEDIIRTNKEEITNEMFENRTNEFRKLFSTQSEE